MSEPAALRWGIVSTIKAPLRQIADFAAYHLDLGAHRLLLYLDDQNEEAFEALSTHPKLRVFRADEANWRGPHRPVKHQVRQSANARHGYRRKAEGLDWLAHIDVDEFIMPINSLEDQLQALPKDCTCARVRPIEVLSSEGTDIPGGTTYFKAMTNNRAIRHRQTEAIYPTYGAQLNGGFLSHVAGKLFIRTGLPDINVKIHNIVQNDVQNPGQQELTGVELCHMHASDFAHWMQSFRYRHEKGAYRAGLAPTRSRDVGGLTLHELFAFILEQDGEDGLRRFYDETCRATPELCERLKAHGLLRCYTLDLNAKRAKHFPDLA